MVTKPASTTLKLPGHSEQTPAAGYRHPQYAASLRQFGHPRRLQHSGGWVLVRDIPESAWQDAMGVYPLFCCQDWTALAADLVELAADGLLSLALVTDPFGAYSERLLREVFNTKVMAFKQHHVLDLSQPIEATTSARHRKKARRALRELDVRIMPEPTTLLDEWVHLYDGLTRRHQIRGIQAFSRQVFETQLALPDVVAVCLWQANRLAGAQLLVFQEDVVHCHLAAFDEIGYEIGASYAMDLVSIEYCRTRARWYNLGGSAGLQENANDGLGWYKGGWSNETRTAYFCGHIFDQARYNLLYSRQTTHNRDFFPAYRASGDA